MGKWVKLTQSHACAVSLDLCRTSKSYEQMDDFYWRTHNEGHHTMQAHNKVSRLYLQVLARLSQRELIKLEELELF